MKETISREDVLHIIKSIGEASIPSNGYLVFAMSPYYYKIYRQRLKTIYAIRRLKQR